MSDQTRSTVTISVDLKKYRIRIFKALIHQMGDAKYVQLLVNPEEMAVALVFAEKESSGDQTHRLSLSTLASYNSVEIYSRPFIDKLCEVVGGLKGGRSYRLTGTAMPAEKVAVFSLKTIVPITKQE